MSSWAQLCLQESMSSPMEEFMYFHDFANMVLLFILSFVGLFMLRMLKSSVIHKGLVEGHLLESIWTLVPGLILLQLALPSLVLLYTLEEWISSKSIILKVIGHQWYWSYNYPEYSNSKNLDLVDFDAYMKSQDSLEQGDFRLLDVDNRVSVPNYFPIQLLITSADVLHAWALPSMGVKADAVPGRLNQIFLESNSVGVFYGQCSEICGANHSFMPIVVQFLDFKDWSNLFF